MDVFVLTLICSLAACLVCGSVQDAITHYKHEQHRKQVFNYLYSDMLKGGKAE